MKIKIEDYYGNDLCSFEVVSDDLMSIKDFKDCGVADYDTDEQGGTYVRIQMDTRIKAGKL